jgi:hypothetical protein
VDQRYCCIRRYRLAPNCIDLFVGQYSLLKAASVGCLFHIKPSLRCRPLCTKRTSRGSLTMSAPEGGPEGAGRRPK